MDDFNYINKTYGLDLYNGKSVWFQGQAGEVVGTKGARLVIRLDERPLEDLIVHPTWQMEYNLRI